MSADPLEVNNETFKNSDLNMFYLCFKTFDCFLLPWNKVCVSKVGVLGTP